MGKGRVRQVATFQWLVGCAAWRSPRCRCTHRPIRQLILPNWIHLLRSIRCQTLASTEPGQDVTATRSYRWSLSGLEGITEAADIRRGFDERSVLEADGNKQANAAQIDRRARADAELLAELLRSYGYYDATVEPTIDAAGQVLQVELAAIPGPLYRFESVELPGLEQAAGQEAEGLRAAFGIKAGDAVVAQQVIDAGVALQVALGERGFATAKVGEQDIVVDHEVQTARLVLPVTPGPIARFGQISVTGEPPLSSRHVQRIARFKPGDRYEQSEVADLRRALIATGLISSVELNQVPRDEGQVIDLAVKLEPAPMRTIAGEVGYGTGEGIRAEASWQHRNMFNPEGALTLRGVIGTQEQLGAVIFRRNNWLRRDQVLNAQALASHVDRDAYEAKTLSLSGGFERQSNFIWQKKWTWSLEPSWSPPTSAIRSRPPASRGGGHSSSGLSPPASDSIKATTCLTRPPAIACSGG